MRLTSDSADFVDIARVANESDDVLLLVVVKRVQFSATIDTWVQRQVWFAFAQELSVLEERRQGAARLESILPGELNLVVRSLDPIGHMGVEGQVATTTFDSEVALRFSVFAFDPSQLVAFARRAREMSEAIGRER